MWWPVIVTHKARHSPRILPVNSKRDGEQTEQMINTDIELGKLSGFGFLGGWKPAK